MCARVCSFVVCVFVVHSALFTNDTHQTFFFHSNTKTETNPQQQPHLITVLGEVKLGTSLFSCHVCLLCHTRTHARAHTHTHTVFLCEDATRSYNTEADHEFLRPCNHVQVIHLITSCSSAICCFATSAAFCCFLLAATCCSSLLLTA